MNGKRYYRNTRSEEGAAQLRYLELSFWRRVGLERKSRLPYISAENVSPVIFLSGACRVCYQGKLPIIPLEEHERARRIEKLSRLRCCQGREVVDMGMLSVSQALTPNDSPLLSPEQV